MRRALTVVGLLLLLKAELPACSCSGLTVCQMIEKSQVIFVGEVIDGGLTSLQQDPWHTQVEDATFRVIEHFRGLPPETKTVKVKIRLWPGMCSPNPYVRGKRYLVPLYGSYPDLSDGVCFKGEEVEHAKSDIEHLRDHFAGKLKTTVKGQVGFSRYPGSLMRYELRTGEAKAVAGAKVSARKGDEVFSATANQAGEYSIALPGPGTYLVDAFFPRFASPSPMKVAIGSGGCAIQDIAIRPENSITGRVLDKNGDPVEGVKVGVVDAMPSFEKPYIRIGYSEAGGLYTINEIPPGRYVLAVNPEGPTNRYPQLTTYYPQGAAREAAQPVDIVGNQDRHAGLDLITREVQTFRKVTVEAVFEDGTHMRTASISVRAEPKAPGEVEWMDRKVTLHDKTEEFLAPVGRKLTIEVKDWHGRDLGAVYESTHEAGTEPIFKKFVVKP